MRRDYLFKVLMTLWAVWGIAIGAFAQQITVNGVVQDTQGEPIIGANILVKGTANGTITDLDGNFQLTADADALLVISYIGYVTQELPAQPVMNITLREDAEQLEEVVVIGYGSVKKNDLSGSVVAIKAEDMNKGAVTSPQELIQGKVPGLYVSAGDGQPGAGSSIRIRGGASLNASNDPLIVIDGVPVANDAAPGTPNALATINPNDIETFTVLKDASATAIYGSRASNGVILITTKKGTQDRIKVNYAGTFTVKDPYKRVKVMGADEFRETTIRQYPQGTTLGDAAQAMLNMYPDQSTNWQDEIFRTGLATDQNISVAGKVAFMPFRVSVGYNTERGTLRTSQYDRYTASMNLSPKFLDDHLSIDLNVKGTINKTRFAESGAVGAAAFFDPTKPVYNDTGRYNGYWTWETLAESDGTTTYYPNTLASVNPLAMLEQYRNRGTTNRSLGNLQIDYKIHGFEELRANLNLGYDVAKSTGSRFDMAGSPQAALNTTFKDIGQGATWNSLRRNLLLDFYVNYNKEFKSIQSRIDAMAGYSWQHFYNSDFDITKSNPTDAGEKEGWTYVDEERRFWQDGYHRIPKENYLVSFFGRLNWHYMDRYLLTATLRRDGSSRFSSNNRWGTFPSVAFAWTILNEPWMEPAREVLSNLKLRLGYGVTGQQEIGDYLYLPTYSLGTNPTGQYLGSYLLKPNGYSPDLKWEETTTYNLGIDFGFLNNRITGTLEYYDKRTKDLLNSVSAPAGTNFTNIITANVGKMRNQGVEFNINAVAIQNNDFTWELGYNFTWNKSRITKLTAAYNPDYPGIAAGNAPFATGTTIQYHQVGYAPSTFYLYQQVYDEQGHPVQNEVVDRNKDGEITQADQYMTGKSPMPKVFMGLNSQFKYKNWDLGFNLRANFGNYVFNGFAADHTTLAHFNNQGFINNYAVDAGKYGWTKISENYQKTSDLYLENASFLKMDNITVGYTFDKFFTDKISGRVSASVQNVFTITGYNGLDPETSAIDSNIWPRPRTFTIGLNLNF
ncbi:MAG: TonB-dependent receptor [Bacteroides sp.]|nr:TonB-dependent receptor [Bacteroides sp.]